MGPPKGEKESTFRLEGCARSGPLGSAHDPSLARGVFDDDHVEVGIAVRAAQHVVHVEAWNCDRGEGGERER